MRSRRRRTLSGRSTTPSASTPTRPKPSPGATSSTCCRCSSATTRSPRSSATCSGDGEDDRSTGILETSGVQVQAFTTDLLTTLSAAKYKLLGQERAITGWALNPLDLQALEMLRENGATGAFLFKSRADIEGFLGPPVVTSLGLPTGTAVAADWNRAELLPVGDDELVFDGKNRTANNTFLLMFEGRYGFRVKKPFDFVKVALTA
ncbi:phage major capsid protein [Microbacterium sp. BWT-B31]|uniref:phage major capsid family protein n=1 Tax=Microbacterium sp. BWT-B31 TaxID=3232072 RepID=UPI0035271E01